MGSVGIIAVLVVYLVILLLIGAWGSRDSGTVKGYFVAGKQLPSWVVAFSSNATGESAWLLLGLTGMGYTVGIHALWIVMGEVLGVALGWAVVALPLKEYTDRYDSITVPDYLESRLRDSGHVIRVLSAIIIFTMVSAYTAAQLTASGKAFASFLDTSYTAGVLIGAAVILYYTTVGGFKAVAYSDLLQGVLMFGSLLVLPIVGFVAAGGWMPVVSALREADPVLLEPMGVHGLTLAGVISVASFMGIGLAFLGAPQLLTRFMAARDREALVDGGMIAVLCVIVFDVGAVLAGMSGRVLFPDLADPETILPTMTRALLPPVLTGVFLVTVLAAIMSTVDSLLILASSAIVRDVVQTIWHPELTERQLSRYAKMTTVTIGAVALAFALTEVRVIFWFVLFAWSGLASAFTPVVLCTLFWARTTRAGVAAGMVAGFLTAVIWVVAFKAGFHDLYEMLPGFGAGFVATVVVSLMTEPPPGAAEEMADIHATVRS